MEPYVCDHFHMVPVGTKFCSFRSYAICFYRLSFSFTSSIFYFVCFFFILFIFCSLPMPVRCCCCWCCLTTKVVCCVHVHCTNQREFLCFGTLFSWDSLSHFHRIQEMNMFCGTGCVCLRLVPCACAPLHTQKSKKQKTKNVQDSIELRISYLLVRFASVQTLKFINGKYSIWFCECIIRIAFFSISVFLSLSFSICVVLYISFLFLSILPFCFCILSIFAQCVY